jgi:predicted Rossmann-fold nucleotide-binding protein
MAKILIAGALNLSQDNAPDFVRYLGEEVVEQGHILLNGCRNEFDKMVAKGAYDLLKVKGIEPEKYIISYAIAGSEPAHEFGTVLRSRLPTWGLEFKRLYIPEPIHKADAVIIVGGQEGTMCAANWARIDNKPILPITAFGGAAASTYNEEIKDFESKYGDRIEQFQYETLNQVPLDLRKVAKDSVSLAARITTSKHVFVVMSFSPDPKLEDAYQSFVDVCKEYQYECKRLDDLNALDRIIPEIFMSIQKSAFVIVDLTEERANVYYELGFAQGLNKPVVITAYKGTLLPFDINDIPTIFWEGQKQLKERLKERIGEIASGQGR